MPLGVAAETMRQAEMLKLPEREEARRAEQRQSAQREFGGLTGELETVRRRLADEKLAKVPGKKA